MRCYWNISWVVLDDPPIIDNVVTGSLLKAIVLWVNLWTCGVNVRIERVKGDPDENGYLGKRPLENISFKVDAECEAQDD